MLAELRQRNPGLEILEVTDPGFAMYGTIHHTVELPEMRRFLYAKEKTEDEFYVPCDDTLMEMEEAKQFKDDMFGQVPCQVGWYYGNGTKLNAIEYHKCSEVLYEYEPCILILGLLWDIKDDSLDTGTMKLFYVPANTCVELYATTLHYAPCRAGRGMVMQIVAQSMGTNTPLLKPADGYERENKYLLQRNKWVLVHPEAAKLIPDGFVGLNGNNITINPIE